MSRAAMYIAILLTLAAIGAFIAAWELLRRGDEPTTDASDGTE